MMIHYWSLQSFYEYKMLCLKLHLRAWIQAFQKWKEFFSWHWHLVDRIACAQVTPKTSKTSNCILSEYACPTVYHQYCLLKLFKNIWVLFSLIFVLFLSIRFSCKIHILFLMKNLYLKNRTKIRLKSTAISKTNTEIKIIESYKSLIII